MQPAGGGGSSRSDSNGRSRRRVGHPVVAGCLKTACHIDSIGVTLHCVIRAQPRGGFVLEGLVVDGFVADGFVVEGFVVEGRVEG